MYSATMKDGYRMGMITAIMLFGWVSGLGAQELQQDDVVWAQDSLMVAHIHQQILGSGECYEDLSSCKPLKPQTNVCETQASNEHTKSVARILFVLLGTK